MTEVGFLYRVVRTYMLEEVGTLEDLLSRMLVISIASTRAQICKSNEAYLFPHHFHDSHSISSVRVHKHPPAHILVLVLLVLVPHQSVQASA